MRRRAVQSFTIAIAAVLALAAPAAAQAPEPYVDPPFAEDCVVHEYGEGEAPSFGSLDDDPLCVRYAKEDITVDDGGALAFLAGEPERVAAAAGVCAYWQQDRWSVQLSDGTQSLVSWAGSYWFDRGTGQAAAILRDFQIGGQPAGADQVAALIEPLSAEWAETLREYSGGPDGGAGGWMTFGGSDPSCATAGDEPGDEPGDDPGDPADGRRRDEGRGAQRGGGPQADAAESNPAAAAAAGDAVPASASLPRTGGGALTGAAIAATVIGLGLWRMLRDRADLP